MLISSSLPSAAAWFNEQLSEPANFATQILPDPTRTPLTPGTPTQPAKSEHRAPARVSRGPEATDQKDTKQVKQHTETRRRSGRHVARKDAGSAGTAEAENQAPFLSLLGDILPNDGQTGARKPDSGGNLEWASATSVSYGAGMPADTGTNGSANIVAAATAQAQTAGNSSVATATATTTSREGDPAGQIDPSVEITKAAASIDAQRWQTDAGDPGQVAFTARITELAAVPATQGLSRADAAIAAARFDTSNAGSHFTTSGNAQPHPAPLANANQLADPTANRALEQAKPVGTEEPFSFKPKRATAGDRRQIRQRTGGCGHRFFECNAFQSGPAGQSGGEFQPRPAVAGATQQPVLNESKFTVGERRAKRRPVDRAERFASDQSSRRSERNCRSTGRRRGIAKCLAGDVGRTDLIQRARRLTKPSHTKTRG